MFNAFPIVAVYAASKALESVCSIAWLKPGKERGTQQFPSYKAALAWLKLQSAFDFQELFVYDYKNRMIAKSYLDACEVLNTLNQLEKRK